MPELENAKRERFCQELLVDDNATQAYIRSGYSPNGASQSAEKLLRNAEVAARVAELRAERSKKATTSAEWVVSELEKIARADVRRFFNDDGTLKAIHELDDDEAAALSAFEVTAIGDTAATVNKFKRWDRPKVLELLGKHHGLWPNKAADRIAESLEELINASYAKPDGEKK